MTVLINASNTSGLTFTSDTSGNVAIQSSGSNVITTAGSNVTVAGVLTATGGIVQGASAAPAFSVYLASTTSITANSDIKIPFDTKLFDTNSNFNTSTNRFTPTVSGYYQFSLGIQPEGSTSVTRVILIINKNGSNQAVLQDLSSSAVNKMSGSQLIYMNGSTDYVEGHCYVFASVASLSNAASGTWFTGAMVRSA